MSNKPRNSSIELLRVFFMFLILTIHVYGHGSGLDYNWIYSLGADCSTAWNLSLYSLGKIGVTGFIFISGYYGIKTSRRSLFQILMVPLFYTLLLSLAYHHYHLADVINIIFAFNGWWFVSCYVFLMLLAPFIEKGVKALEQKRFLMLLSGMVIYTYVMRFFSKDNSHDIIFFLTIYMGARYLKNYPTSLLPTIMRRGGVMAFVLLLSAPVAIEQIGWKAESLNAYFLQNNNFLLFIACYWIIYQCEKKTFHNNMVNTLATGSLAIYLVTDYPDVRTMLTPWILPYLLKGYGAIMIAGICLVILLADQLRQYLFKILNVEKLIVNRF